MKNKKRSSRWLCSAVLLCVLLLVAMGIWYLSGKSGVESHAESKAVAKYLENVAAEHFIINRNDTFWRVTLEMILRKAAHFLEYIVMGIAACTFLNVLTQRVWLAAVLSAVVCPIFAYMDEYRQKFISGRTPQWFDVKIDSYGALLGIMITTVIFFLWRYIKKLRSRIYELECDVKGKDGFGE